jgi:hypothetical protein
MPALAVPLTVVQLRLVAAAAGFASDTVNVTAVVRERHDFQPGTAVMLRPMSTFLFDRASGARLA